MRHIASAAVIAVLILTTWEVSAGSRGKRNVSSSGAYSFQVESAGRVLPVYKHKGRSYVEGRYGNTYALRVFNHTGQRVEAVITVDGRDVVSGKIGNYNAERGYVIDPYDSVLIEGFRKSWSNVAAFTFTGINNAYATRMGDGSNVGVIGVAIFKERTYRPKPRPAPVYSPRRDSKSGLGTGYGGASESKAKRSRAPSAEYEAHDDAGGLGTGYGNTTYAPSTQTTFKRASRRPNAVLAMRYNDRQGLIALGVLPRPRPYYRSPKPEPFPNSPEPVTFAPPPPPRQWWE